LAEPRYNSDRKDAKFHNRKNQRQVYNSYEIKILLNLIKTRLDQ